MNSPNGDVLLEVISLYFMLATVGVSFGPTEGRFKLSRRCGVLTEFFYAVRKHFRTLWYV